MRGRALCRKEFSAQISKVGEYVAKYWKVMTAVQPPWVWRSLHLAALNGGGVGVHCSISPRTHESVLEAGRVLFNLRFFTVVTANCQSASHDFGAFFLGIWNFPLFCASTSWYGRSAHIFRCTASPPRARKPSSGTTSRLKLQGF